ncbi:MAG: DMT family transporter [Proteobacteria bacterium]|uniref:DMT family transporter n=1 Tax=Rudaea sp. TaxID=2136325 RepID=UPI001D947A48|nr:DMT family transporter [Pseudomonadota bacterium]MBS0567092.1 DMT family transporter [Pseudomonadota bacterium]
MNASIFAQLVVLGMIWGASFMFQRITVPVIGAGMTGAGRMIFAALTLLGVLALLRKPLQWRARWRDYVVVGIIVMGLPLTCFAVAARSLPAGYLAVLNATVPLFAVLIGWASSRVRPSASKLAGVVVGVCGVATLAKFGHLEMNWPTVLGFAAALFASFLYAIGAIMAKQRYGDADPLVITAGNLIGGSLPLVPLAIATAPAALPSGGVTAALVALGILCTGIAYALYFRILRAAGVERTVTVTFLVPLFALIWAALFLGEPITWAAATGCALVLFAVALIFEKVPGFARRPVPRIGQKLCREQG